MIRRFAKRIRELHYFTILIAQIVLLCLIAVMQDHIVLVVLFVLGLFGVFGSAISTIWGRTLPRALAIAFGAIAILGGIPALIPTLPLWDVRTALAISSFAYSGFILIAIIAIGKSVFITDRVTANRIIGSVCIYLLIGLFFAFLIGAAALAIPHSYYFGQEGEGPLLLHTIDIVYFSFSTLTTSGFGDMVATHPVTKMLASFEAVIGSLYVAVMVARLVGMHISQSHGRREG